jgi:hypothetical protein
MRTIYSYCRLVLASWLFMGGLAVQFLPTAASLERDGRRRERQLQAVAIEERAQWMMDRDIEDGRSQAYLRLLGVLVGGLGLAGAIVEAAYLSAHFGYVRLPSAIYSTKS